MDYFEKIFIINLDHRTDRWQKIQEELKKLNITNYERFSAKRPEFEELKPEWYSRLVSPMRLEILGRTEKGELVGRWNKSYVRGALGCKMSHKSIIELAKSRGYKNFLVFEDDVEFCNEPVEDILKNALKNIPNDWEMLYLSGNHLIPPTNLTENLCKVYKTLTTHAYAMNSNIYDLALNNMMSSGVEIDNYYIDEIQSRGKSYTVKPTLLNQGVGYSDVLNRNVDYTRIIS